MVKILNLLLFKIIFKKTQHQNIVIKIIQLFTVLLKMKY